MVSKNGVARCRQASDLSDPARHHLGLEMRVEHDGLGLARRVIQVQVVVADARRPNTPHGVRRECRAPPCSTKRNRATGLQRRAELATDKATWRVAKSSSPKGKAACWLENTTRSNQAPRLLRHSALLTKCPGVTQRCGHAVFAVQQVAAPRGHDVQAVPVGAGAPG